MKIIHPLYLVTLDLDIKDKILFYPQLKNDKIVYSNQDKNIKNMVGNDIVNATFTFNDINFLNYLYNINGWDDLYNYLKKKNLNKNTLNRLLNLCWNSYPDYKYNYDKIFSCYKLYYPNINKNKLLNLINKIKDKKSYNKIIIKQLNTLCK